MADQYTLVAEQREEQGTGNARRLRRAGRLPAVVYGLGNDPVAVTVEGNEVVKLLHRGGHNALINLQVGGENLLTIAREIQRHPVRGDLLHVDFVRIRADLAIEASVPVHLIGEPAGAKDGGVLEHVLFEIAVSAKPGDIPQAIELDVSELGVGENLKAEDVRLPAGVELVTEPDRVVANLMAPRGMEAAGLTPEQIAELEGLTEEELQALRALAAPAAEAPEEAAEEAGEEAVEEAGGEAASEEGGGGEA